MKLLSKLFRKSGLPKPIFDIGQQIELKCDVDGSLYTIESIEYFKPNLSRDEYLIYYNLHDGNSWLESSIKG